MPTRSDQLTLLGVPFALWTRARYLDQIRTWLRDKPTFHFITTPNPEFLVRGVFDSQFRRLLCAADLRLPDGIGLLLASQLLWGRRLHRLTGVDCIFELARLTADQPTRFFLLGSRSGVAQQAGECLRRLFPRLQIVGTESGDGPDSPGGPEALVQRISDARPDVLLVAFGAPRQERWIDAHRESFPTVRLAMGVGGAFDYLSGSIPRAPRAWQRLGLEWLYRLYRQPWRVGRMATATIAFPVLAIAERLWRLASRDRFRYTGTP